MKFRPFIHALALLPSFAVLAGDVRAAAEGDGAAGSATNSIPSQVEGTNSVSVAHSADSSSTNAPVHTTDRGGVVPKLDQASFRLISDRNIFNPNRSPRNASGKSNAEPRKVVKVESLSLLGTMSYQKGDLAFFDGSGSDFKKVVKPEDTIAGFKVQQISFNQVSLVREGKTMTLPVGGKLRKQDDGPWELNGSADKGSSDSVASSSESGGSSDSGSGDGAESDVLKRLLKKREQEMKNEK